MMTAKNRSETIQPQVASPVMICEMAEQPDWDREVAYVFQALFRR